MLQNLPEANPSLLVAGFPAKYAVALSNFTIVGGAVANLFFNINRRHSFKPKPLIDWDLILVMEPSTILGAVIGGYLNKVNGFMYKCKIMYKYSNSLHQVFKPISYALSMV